MSTLYEITSEYMQLLSMADEDDEAFLDTLEAITGELEVKAEGYAVVINEINTNIAKFDKEIERLKARKETMERHVKNMKDRLRDAMLAMGKDEIQTEHYKFKVRNNGGVLPLTILGDIPDSYKKIELKPDNEKIRKDLEAGKKLNFAELGVRGKYLKIT